MAPSSKLAQFFVPIVCTAIIAATMIVFGLVIIRRMDAESKARRWHEADEIQEINNVENAVRDLEAEITSRRR